MRAKKIICFKSISYHVFVGVVHWDLDHVGALLFYFALYKCGRIEWPWLFCDRISAAMIKCCFKATRFVLKSKCWGDAF